MLKARYRVVVLFVSFLILVACSLTAIEPPTPTPDTAATEQVQKTAVKEAQETAVEQARIEATEQAEQAEAVNATAAIESFDAQVEEFGYAVILTEDAEYPATVFALDGSAFSSKIGGDGSVESAVWIAPDDQGTIVVNIGADNLPESMVYGENLEFVAQFSNYTSNTVDISVLLPDGSSVTETGVAVDPEWISSMQSASYRGRSAGRASIMYEPDYMDWDQALRFGSTALAGASCVASIITMPATFGVSTLLTGLACSNAILKGVQLLYPDVENEAVPWIGTVDSLVGCGSVLAGHHAGIFECGSLALEGAEIFIDLFKVPEQVAMEREDEIELVFEVFITADATRITVGDCVELAWGSTNAFNIAINGEYVNSTGTKQVCPDASTTYTITGASMRKRVLSDSVEITVLDANGYVID
jgi:hypothetical protein